MTDINQILLAEQDRADKAEARANELEAKLTVSQAWIGSVLLNFEQTIAEHENCAKGRPGMQVPFFGPFAAVVKFPTVITYMRRAVRDYRNAITLLEG